MSEIVILSMAFTDGFHKYGISFLYRFYAFQWVKVDFYP